MNGATDEARALERHLPDEQATARLGEDIAMALRAGDVLALSGDLGAGKTTLARGLIRAMAGDAGLDVPSPTFTLVQSYADARAARIISTSTGLPRPANSTNSGSTRRCRTARR